MKKIIFVLALLFGYTVHGASIPWLQRYQKCGLAFRRSPNDYSLPNGMAVVNSSRSLKEALIFPGINGADGGVWIVRSDRAEFLPIPSTVKNRFLLGEVGRGFTFASDPGPRKKPDTSLYVSRLTGKPVFVVTDIEKRSDDVSFDSVNLRSGVSEELKEQYQDFLLKMVAKIQKNQVPESHIASALKIQPVLPAPRAFEKKTQAQSEEITVRKVVGASPGVSEAELNIKALTACRDALSSASDEEAKLLNIVEDKIRELNIPDPKKGETYSPTSRPAI